MSKPQALKAGLPFESGKPLYERAPTRDVDGTPFSDFMMLFPGLRDLPTAGLVDRTATIQAVLGGFNEVVFADLNVRLNLLWVSVRPKPGVILEIATCMKFHAPEALLVGHQ